MNPSSFRSKSSIDVDEAIKNQNDIALVVSKDLFSTKAKHSNSVFSPASINTALTLAASGPGDYSGSEEILSFLRASSTDELNAIFSKIVPIVFADRSANGGPKISSINGVWVEKTLPVDLSLKDLFENFFKAVFDRVDFLYKAEQVRRELNEWAEAHTNGLIKDLLPEGSITDQTSYVYGNALYFKGQWEVPFDKSYTKDKEFHLLSGTSVSVPFMRSYKDQYIKAYDGFKVLRIPYRQGCDGDVDSGSFSMYFYLPDKNDGLDGLVKAMASDSGFLDCHVPSRKVAVNEFRIPKFKIVDEVDGKDLGLCSTLLYHKACVEIDEEGAEAAAATFVVSLGCAYMKPPEEIDFVADHPFLFLIREDTIGTVLFVGQIMDPSDKSS
ncbi:Serpin-Z1 [Raphanus sativus]|uniref:Serpin-Z1 n=1 Tax=Raphanus sativus TaxID=3726 RepID=A0A6J0JMS1_RAPSA|nr:serpin-Z1 [Raphanus sativus]KAJ4887393.1 Serpin-Z1 [Raphanus sativus]